VKRVISMTIAVLVLTGLSAAAATKPDKEKAHQTGKKTAPIQSEGGDRANAMIHVAFGTGEIQLVRSHYAPRYRNLPPGLQKKLARGGSLPPGWQKKIEPFPVTLERGLPRLPAGYSRGVIDGHAVIYNSTGMIIDVAVLF
jgi:hypothetical protein